MSSHGASQWNSAVAVATAQAAYSFFASQTGNPQLDLASLNNPDGGEFTEIFGRRFLGLDDSSGNPFGNGMIRIAYRGDELNGFSASVFRNVDTEQAYLAVRGSNGLADFIQDAKLSALGYASDQFISLIRYYRQLTSPEGQQVQYSAADIELMHRLNSIVALPSLTFLTNAALDLQ